jgi:hypothetical protein
MIITILYLMVKYSGKIEFLNYCGLYEQNHLIENWLSSFTVLTETWKYKIKYNES